MITFNASNGTYTWEREDGEGGEAATYIEARYNLLFPALYQAAMVWAWDEFDANIGKEDRAQGAVLAIWQWMQRKPEAATEAEDTYIIHRARLYAKRESFKHARTKKAAFEKTMIRADAPLLVHGCGLGDTIIPDSLFPVEDDHANVMIDSLMQLLPRQSYKIIVRMLAQGFTQREIGSALGITYKAVQAQIKTIGRLLAACGGADLLHA